MKDVITKINELYDVLTVRLRKQEADQSQLEATKAELDKQLADIKARKEKLAQDEKRVGEFKTLADIRDRVREEEQKLDTKRVEFLKATEAETKELNISREENERLWGELYRKQEKMAKERAKLDEEKKTYRQTVFDDVIRETKALNRVEQAGKI